MTDEVFRARLNEMRIPHKSDLKDYPEMIQHLTDRLNEFISGDPMMVTFIPTSNSREILRIETQSVKNPKERRVSYVWPRENQ